MSRDYQKENQKELKDDNSLNMELWKDFEEIDKLDTAELLDRLEAGMDEFRELITKLENANLSPEDITDEQVVAINRNTATFVEFMKSKGIEIVEEDPDAR